MSINITEDFYFVDDFGKKFGFEDRHLLQFAAKKPTRVPGLCHSEIVTILLLYAKSRLKTFKDFYLNYLPAFKSEFPKMPSYERFVTLKQRVVEYLNALLDHLFKTIKAERFLLEVRVSNTAAIELYKKLGFIELSRRKDYYPTAQGREDAIVFALSITLKVAEVFKAQIGRAHV